MGGPYGIFKLEGTWEDRHHYTELLRKAELQSSARRVAHKYIKCGNRCKAKLPTLAFLILTVID